MMKFMLFQDNSTREGGPELLDEWRNNPQSWLWIDLYNEPADQEKAFLVKEFNLDSIAILEAQRQRHPPGFEDYGNYLFILLKPMDAESDSLDFNTLQLAMFAGERFLITRHSKESPYLARLWTSLSEGETSRKYPLSIVASLSRRVAQRYGKVLLHLEERLDAIEDELFDSASDVLMKELVSYNTGLRKMHRILTYYVNVFDSLRKYLAETEHAKQDTFDDIFEVIERFNSLAGMYQNVISDLVDAYISLNGHKLNQIMKVLTVVTVIFVPLTLLVGIYGMNFENMPELKSAHGYFILLSVMLFIATSLMFVFRKMRWL